MLTLILTCYQLTVVGLGEGLVRNCLDADIDPTQVFSFSFLLIFVELV